MFRGLRLQLTLLYLLATLLLLGVVGTVAYALLQSSFQHTIDLALQYRMAQEFALYRAPLPSRLSSAVNTYIAEHSKPPTSTPVPTRIVIVVATAQPSGDGEGVHATDNEQSTTPPSSPPLAPAQIGHVAATATTAPDGEGGSLPLAPPIASAVVRVPTVSHEADTPVPPSAPPTGVARSAEGEKPTALAAVPTARPLLVIAPTVVPSTGGENVTATPRRTGGEQTGAPRRATPTPRPSGDGGGQDSMVIVPVHAVSVLLAWLNPMSVAHAQNTAANPVRGDALPTARPSATSETSDLLTNYDSEVAATFALPLSARGALLRALVTAAPPFPPDAAAAQRAYTHGIDWATVQQSGVAVRFLSYRLHGPKGLAVLQVGRTLTDQYQILHQLLLGLLVLGGVCIVLLGAASWWLAGRSLTPAQSAWEQQRSFVANASHELRAPLTLLRASAEVTHRHLPADDAKGRALLADVLGECDHMARLIEDLLLLSKLDANALKMDCQAVSLPDLLADTQRQVGRVATGRGVTVNVEPPPGAIVWADPARLRQVLLILLDNALRYTPAGGTIRIVGQPRGRQVQLSVLDSGSGIAPEHLPHLFERFYRAEATRLSGSSEETGSGLGLAIAHALVSAQRGSIHIDSTLGVGTRVDVVLPMPV